MGSGRVPREPPRRSEGCWAAAELQGSWQTPTAEIQGRVFCREQSSNERLGSYTFSLPESDLETSCSASSSGASSPPPFLKQSSPSPPGDASFGWICAAHQHPALGRGRIAFLRLGRGGKQHSLGDSLSHRRTMSGVSQGGWVARSKPIVVNMLSVNGERGYGWPPGRGDSTWSLLLLCQGFEHGSKLPVIILV